MARLSKAAVALLEAAGYTEVADDYVLVGNTDVRILLSVRAVRDLNAQARGEDVEPVAQPAARRYLSQAPDPKMPDEPLAPDPYLEGIRNR